MLLDQFGNPIKVPSRKQLEEVISAPSIGSVRQVTGGYPADGLTPGRLTQILRAADQGDIMAYLEMAEQMEEKDLHYGSVLGTRKRAIRALELRVTAGGDSDADEDAAGLVREALSSTAIKDDLIGMLDAIGKGFSVTEILWDTSTTQWKIARLEERDPRWFTFDPADGRTVLMRDTVGNVPLRPFKFISHFAKAKSGIPIRCGLARLIAWAYLFKNYTVKDWMIFMEAYGHPLRLGKFDPSASEEDRATLLRAVRNIGSDMAAIVPKSMEIDIVEANKVGGDRLFKDAANWWDQQTSKAVLGQTGTTDAIAGGHAVGKVHNEIRHDIRDADSEQLAATLQRDVATPLTKLNFADYAKVPVISFVAPEEHDPRLLISAAKTFGPMGWIVPVEVINKAFGVRRPEEGEAVLRMPVRGAPALPPETASAQRITHAKTDQDHTHDTELDDLITRLIDGRDAAEASAPFLDELVDAIGATRSLDDVRDILAQFADTSPDQSFQELIAQVMFAGRLAGETGADISE